MPFFPFALSHELVCKRGIMLPLRDIGCNRSSTNSIRCNCNKMLSTYHGGNILNNILADCKSVSIYIRISDLKRCVTLCHHYRYSKTMLVSDLKVLLRMQITSHSPLGKYWKMPTVLALVLGIQIITWSFIFV